MAREINSTYDTEEIGEVFNILKRSYSLRIPNHVFDQMELSKQIDYASGEMLYRLDSYLASTEEMVEEPEVIDKDVISPVETNHVHDYVDIPSTWWDMFKKDILNRCLGCNFKINTTQLCTVRVSNYITKKHVRQIIVKKTIIRPDVPVPDNARNSDKFVRRTINLTTRNGRIPYSA